MIIDGLQAFRARFSISHETGEKLALYADLLKRWQKKINLVAPSTLDCLWHRHFADSAQLVEHLPPDRPDLLDLGSGAGFPGLVLAILLADIPRETPPAVTLVESDNRKAAFLREVARQTGVPVDILCTRIESRETIARLRIRSCMTARALAPLPKLLAWSAPFFGDDSMAVFLKGRDVDSEIDQARQNWTFTVDLKPSITDDSGRIVILKNLQAKAQGDNP